MGSFWDRYTRTRISRRRMLAGSAAGAAGLAALALSGCGDDGVTAVPSATVESRPDRPDYYNADGAPQYGGTLVTANSATLGTFDPHLGIEVASAYFPRMYNVLLNQSPTKPEYFYFDLAESLETPDDTTYVFTLRPGVRIAPNDMGVPERDLDGEDVRVTFERLRTDPRANNYSFAGTYLGDVRVDGATVTITTPEPYAWFVSRIGSFYNCIAPRELIAGNLDRLSNAGAGAGPYRLTSVRENERALFERNPHYYRRDAEHGDARLPYIDALDVRVILDRSPQRTAFEDGQLHQYWPASGEEARSLDAIIVREPVFSFIAFVMNPDREPFKDPRVRRAVALAIDRQEYVDRIYAGDAQVDGLVHWPLGSYALPPEELAEVQRFDVEEARALVEQVGGIRFKMIYPAETTIWEHGQHLPIFLQQMRRANIEVEEEPLIFGSWVSRFLERGYESNLALNQIYETPEIPLLAHVTEGPFGDKTYVAGLGDPEVDAAVRRCNTTIDLEERIEAVRETQRLIYSKDPLFLPLVSPYLHMAYSKKVHNIPAGVGTTNYLLSSVQWLEA